MQAEVGLIAVLARQVEADVLALGAAQRLEQRARPPHVADERLHRLGVGGAEPVRSSVGDRFHQPEADLQADACQRLVFQEVEEPPDLRAGCLGLLAVSGDGGGSTPRGSERS